MSLRDAFPSEGNPTDGAPTLPLAGLVSKLGEHREGDLKSARRAGPMCFWAKAAQGLPWDLPFGVGRAWR